MFEELPIEDVCVRLRNTHYIEIEQEIKKRKRASRTPGETFQAKSQKNPKIPNKIAIINSRSVYSKFPALQIQVAYASSHKKICRKLTYLMTITPLRPQKSHGKATSLPTNIFTHLSTHTQLIVSVALVQVDSSYQRKR